MVGAHERAQLGPVMVRRHEQVALVLVGRIRLGLGRGCQTLEVELVGVTLAVHLRHNVLIVVISVAARWGYIIFVGPFGGHVVRVKWKKQEQGRWIRREKKMVKTDSRCMGWRRRTVTIIKSVKRRAKKRKKVSQSSRRKYTFTPFPHFPPETYGTCRYKLCATRGVFFRSSTAIAGEFTTVGQNTSVCVTRRSEVVCSDLSVSISGGAIVPGCYS